MPTIIIDKGNDAAFKHNRYTNGTTSHQ